MTLLTFDFTLLTLVSSFPGARARFESAQCEGLAGGECSWRMWHTEERRETGGCEAWNGDSCVMGHRGIVLADLLLTASAFFWEDQPCLHKAVEVGLSTRCTVLT